jgi:hypothetical protein
MPDPAERFIAAAVAPLGDNAELQMMAAQELRGGIVFGPLQEHCDSLETAAGHLETGRDRRRWKKLLYATTAILAVTACIPVILDVLKFRVGQRYLGSRGTGPVPMPAGPRFGGAVPARLQEIFGHLSANQELLLFGDPAAGPSPDRFRALWAGDPTNPMFFADYARACVESAAGLPPDFLDSVDRIDPDNGWCHHLAAGVEARDATVQNHVPYRIAKPGGRFPEYRIKDTSGVAMALRRMAEAAAKPRYDPYESEIYQQRLDVLPPGDDWVGRWLAVDYLQHHPPGSWFDRHHRDLAEVVAAEAWVLASSGDAPGLAKVAADWETCVARSLQTPATSPVDLLSISSGIAVATVSLASAARELGLGELAERHERWENQVRLLRAARDDDGERALFRDEGGILSGYLDPGYTPPAGPPHVDGEDLKPGRLADHAVTRRVVAAVWMVLLAAGALLLALTRYFRGYQPRRLSGALAGILTPADQGWILAGGVLAPFAVHLLLDHATPLGMHDEKFPLGSILLRFSVAGSILLTLPVLIAMRRLACRLGVLGWDRGTIPERRLVRNAAGLVVIAGFFAVAFSDRIDDDLLGWSATVTSLGMIVVVFASMFGPRRSVVRWLAVARAAAPAQVLGVLLMALSSLAYHAREKHWIGKDRLSRIEPGIPAANRYQFEVAEGLRAALLKTLPAASGEGLIGP